MSCHHHEQVIQRITAIADRDLALLHRLQERGLYLRRRPVDLVGQYQVVKQRTPAKLEGSFLGTVDVGTRQVRRQQIRRKLQAVEVAFDTLRENLDGAGLGQAGGTFHEEMAIAEQCDQHPVDQVRLPDNQAARMCLELLELCCDAHQIAPDNQSMCRCRA